MGGAVGVESEMGQGSTFWITLDVERDGDESEQDTAGDVHARIIAVSSDPARAQVLSARAAQLGGTAEAAAGLEALPAATPCIALLDERAWPEHAESWANAVCTVIALRSAAADGLPPQAIRARCATAVAESAPASEWLNALRIAKAHLGARGDVRQPQAIASRTAASPLRVLVADDNRVNQLVTTKVLESAGHTVVLAGDGEQALEILTAEEVDLALLDVNMPVLSGVQAAQIYQFALLEIPACR